MPTTADVPVFSVDEARAMVARLYGIDATIGPLPSERDQNLAVRSVESVLDPEGDRYVLKIANRAESPEMIDAEHAAMALLAPLGLVPHVVPTLTGQPSTLVDGHHVRLVTMLRGRPLAAVRRRTDELFADLGRTVARVDVALVGFDHPALHRTFHWDLARAADVVADYRPLVTDHALRDLIDRLVAIYREQTDDGRRLAELPRSVIHNDANDHNVLVDAHDQRVTGLVDFGDMVHSHTVNDLAIAMAYASLGATDPVAVMGQVVRGYDEVAPLGDRELAVLFPLAAMRLCQSVFLAARQQADRPDDAYLAVSQDPIAATLPVLAATHPRLAHYLLRAACGRPAVPHSASVVAWLGAQAGSLAPLTGHDLATTPVLGLDLGAGDPIVSSNQADNDAERLGRRIFDRMAEAGVEIAAGGYDEPRLLYASDAYAGGNVLDERRTVHLGVDVTMAAGSLIYAPLDATVHAFERVAQRLDYGPMIVLRHDPPAMDGADVPPFFTLYGHLSEDSLDGLAIGQRITKGQQLGRIGSAPTNGDWWPHVHVQLITDLLDVACNFDGACRASQRSTWLSICPDPNLLLGIPDDVLPRRNSIDITDQRVERRRRRIGGSVRLSYPRRPLTIVRGWKQYLYDDTGRQYIDAYNNVPHVGHAHPRVVRAVAEQWATLNTNTRYLHDRLLDYADALVARFPAPLSVCFFTASGSEANELALRLARAHTGCRDVVVMDTAYHGHTTTLIDVSPYKHDGPGGAGAPSWVHSSPIPDAYRGPYRLDDDAAMRYASEVGAVIDGVAAGDGLSAYLAETCPSVAGQIMLPPGFLAEVYRRTRAAGGLCIADEVQTGFGRLGRVFWAFEDHGVVPDIVVLGKPIANGYPMGAVITTAEIAASFDNGMEFFSTFGGSTAAAAAAMATLAVTLDENLPANAAAVGGELLRGLVELAGTHDVIGDVRGAGLFVGVELVRDRSTREPAGDEAGWVVDRLRERGVLVGSDGPHHNVVKIRGPLTLSAGDVGLVLEALDGTLGELAEHGRPD